MAAPTLTRTDLRDVLKKRLESQGVLLTDQQILTILLDIFTVMTNHPGAAISHATNELAAYPQRPFNFGV
jgi:hypothetical protein